MGRSLGVDVLFVQPMELATDNASHLSGNHLTVEKLGFNIPIALLTKVVVDG